MGLVRNLKLWLHPLRMNDPDFGELVFMHISKAPKRSYWECEWMFPPTGNKVFIALRGSESGPESVMRDFYLSLPNRFEEIVEACRPSLEPVFKEWLSKPLPADIFSDLKLSGFSVEDLATKPVRWDVSFETTGEKWLGTTVPFVDGTAMAADVDT